MIINSSELKYVCGVTSKLPAIDEIQVAFAGRSNVGKSSLINGLLGRKNLARTSSSPGKTVTINFYTVRMSEDKRSEDAAPRMSKDVYFVDLPGYGYAKASMQERASWGKMIERYLSSQPGPSAVLLLVDIRHEPTADDVMMYRWIVESGYSPIIVATKKDKIKRSQLSKCLSVIRKKLGAPADTPIIAFSSVTREGRDEILSLLWEL